MDISKLGSCIFAEPIGKEQNYRPRRFFVLMNLQKKILD